MHAPFGPMFPPEMEGTFLLLLIPTMLWVLTLKGFALWHAARAGQKTWFVALLILNTFGLVELLYLIWFRPTPTSLPTTVEPESPAVNSSPQV